MTDPGWALQKAVYRALTTNAKVAVALGGRHVYDHVPRRTPRPYVTFARRTVRDQSSSTETAHEHTPTLNVWAEATGAKKVAAVMAAVRTALHDQDLTLEGHHLVNLRHEFSEIERRDDGAAFDATMRFRALTEPR